MNEYRQWRAWMAKQVGRNDGIGDLAFDMQRDSPDSRPVIVRISGGKHSIVSRPITTVFGFLRWLHSYRTHDRAVLQWVGIAYAEWKQSTQKRRSVSVGIRFQVFKRDGYCCQICGRSARNGAVLEVDHIHPRAKGGSNDPDNLQTLCWDCNRGKRDEVL